MQTHRLRVDLVRLGAVGEVDGEGVAGGQRAAVDGVGAIRGVNVGRKQDRGRRVAGHVAQVDVERVLVAGHDVPGDFLRLARGPNIALGGRSDLERGGGRGEGEEREHGGDHCCGFEGGGWVGIKRFLGSVLRANE